MDAAVRPARPGDLYRFAQQTFECVLQDAGNAAQFGLPLKAAIFRAVVLNGQAKISDRSDEAPLELY